MDYKIPHPRPVVVHPCVDGTYPTLLGPISPPLARPLPPAEAATLDDANGPPASIDAEPEAQPVLSEAAQDDVEPRPTEADPVQSDPPAGPDPAEAEGVSLMDAWLDEHREVVEALARAGEAPQRPLAKPEPKPEPEAEAIPVLNPPPPPLPPPPPVHVAKGDRWTKWKMAEFLRQLAATHSVTAAARGVGMSRVSAYKLRSRLKGQPFDIAWEAAFRHGYDDLAHAALELAMEGEEVPHYYQGELKGTHRKRSPQLIVGLLRMRNRAGAPMLGRYGAAAEFWSERWEQMIQRIEGGSVTWADEKASLGEAELARLALPD